MFKVKNRKTEEIVQVLDACEDEYGKTWFLLWIKDKWCWRAADMFVPPNYISKKKLIIAGSRSFNNFKLIRSVLDEEVDTIEEVICGEAQGADSYGKAWAQYHDIPVKSFPADWQHDGSAAGYIRNHKMGDYADELVAFWDGISPGTKEMIQYMQSLGKPVRVIDFNIYKPQG